jgi:ribosome maturation factor RimP
VLRISVDKVGGIGIEDCTRVSRQVSPALDVADPIFGSYELEVSTPGIERPVQRAEDFARFAGCEIRLKPFGVEAKKRTKGTLVGIHDGVVSVQTAAELRIFPLESIERANLALTLEQFRRLGQGLPPLEEATP